MSGARALGAGAAMPRPAWPAWLPTVLAVGALAAAVTGLLGRLEARPAARADERLWLPSGLFLRESTAGFRETAADALWFQVVQYYGEYRHGRHDLAYFRGMIRGVTTLDPRFLEAYRFGALVLATDMRDVAGGVDLLRRGIQANPDRAMLPFEVGFLHWVLTRDYARAAVWFDAAARAPDADDFTRRFAAFAHKRAGQLEVSYVLWRNLRDTTSDPNMLELAQRMMGKLEPQLRARAAAGAAGGGVPAPEGEARP
ncbi:MAG: hypothetical protein ACYDIE_08880 [Candidatus Krumholzibacteriia bacterium]